MIICKYQCMISKNGGKFEKAHAGRFKTGSNDEADRIIERWNYKGAMSNESDVKYNFYIILYKNATLSELDNIKMPYHTESNC